MKWIPICNTMSQPEVEKNVYFFKQNSIRDLSQINIVPLLIVEKLFRACRYQTTITALRRKSSRKFWQTSIWAHVEICCWKAQSWRVVREATSKQTQVLRHHKKEKNILSIYKELKLSATLAFMIHSSSVQRGECVETEKKKNRLKTKV